jgi:pimeloyl-ACP methyl ester carboxylesterase
MTTEDNGRLDRGDGVHLAWRCLAGNGPMLVFLPGFRSDMEGSKAVRLAAFAAARGQAMLRLDYSGHGASEGRFEDGTIGLWTSDALAVIDALTEGPLILIGSSMGGWIGLLVALARPDRVVGFVGIAAAPDFTERLIWESLPARERDTLLRTGVLQMPSDYGPPTPITLGLVEDGRTHLLLGQPIALKGPVRLLQGQRDRDVPWRMALDLAETIETDDLRVTLVKDGDHRLSRDADLVLLETVVEDLIAARTAG